MEKLPHCHSEKTIEKMPKTEDFLAISDTFKLLSDSTRVKLFWLLCHTEECVINISAIMKMSSPAVAHHLKMLKAVGLIRARREGKEMFYSVANNEKAKMLHQIIESVEKISCPNK